MSMSDIQEEEDNEKHSRKVVSIRPGLYSGGGGTDLGDHWLSELSEGTIFWSRPRGENERFVLEQWMILDQDKDTNKTLIYTDLNQNVWLWVDSIRFCRHNELHSWKTLQEPEAETIVT
jgi:hypothetical protein